MTSHAVVRSTLKTKLDELLRRAAEIETVVSTPGSRDWEENAIESEDDDVLLKVGDITTREISEIKLAISLIDSGRYGRCTTCGKAISKERLTALPYATQCIDCA